MMAAPHALAQPALSAQAGLPPGPTNLVTTLASWLHDPFGFLARCGRRYGEAFTLPELFGQRLVVFRHPEHVRAIMAAPSEVLCGGAAAEPGRWLFGDGSLFILRDAEFQDERRRLQAHFQGNAMRATGNAILARTRAMAGPWRPGQELELYEPLKQLSTDVMVDVMLAGMEASRRIRVRDLILAMNDALGGVVMFVPALQRDLGPWSPYVRVNRIKAQLYALILSEMALRRAGDPPRDVLDHFLAARRASPRSQDDTQLCDAVVTACIAGQETTSKALAWGVEYLLRAPDVLRELRAQLETLGPSPSPDAVVQLPFLNAVVLETLRLASVVPFTPRKVLVPTALGGYHLPAGVTAVACIYLAHRRAECFEDPETFKPQRFLEGEYALDEYLPFGGGVRRCVGSHFAIYEMKLVLATLLAHVDMTSLTPRVLRPVLGGITLGPRGGARVRITHNGLA